MTSASSDSSKSCCFSTETGLAFTLCPVILMVMLVVGFSHSVVSDSCDPTNCYPPDSAVHGISQARTLEWLPFPSPGDLPNPGTEPVSPALQAETLPTEQLGNAMCQYQSSTFINHAFLLEVGFIIPMQMKIQASKS